MLRLPEVIFRARQSQLSVLGAEYSTVIVTSPGSMKISVSRFITSVRLSVSVTLWPAKSVPVDGETASAPSALAAMETEYSETGPPMAVSVTVPAGSPVSDGARVTVFALTCRVPTVGVGDGVGEGDGDGDGDGDGGPRVGEGCAGVGLGAECLVPVGLGAGFVECPGAADVAEVATPPAAGLEVGGAEVASRAAPDAEGRGLPAVADGETAAIPGELLA